MTSCVPGQQVQQNDIECINTSEKEMKDSDVEESQQIRKEQITNDHFYFPNSSSCWVCNGYYGPNFDEPLCGTCHAFLYNTEPAEELEEDRDNDEDVELDNDIMEIPIGDVQPLEVDVRKRSGADVVMSVDRPRPSAPRSLSQLMELLCEACVNTNEMALGAVIPAVRPNNVLSLPVAITVIIFSYLDDMSMWKASEVCKQWHAIITANTSQQMWRKYFIERWPLFQNRIYVQDWMKLYGALMSSCFCRTCLLQMALKTPQRGRQEALRDISLKNDFRLLHSYYATEGIEAIPLDKQNSYWQASILGPPGSPYENGKFFIFIIFPETYPLIPPTVRFLTKILHPNVSRHGDVGIDIFQEHKWTCALRLSKVLLSVQSLLTDPYTEVCMEPDLGYMYEHNRSRFESLARSWTWKYAMFEQSSSFGAKDPMTADSPTKPTNVKQEFLVDSPTEPTNVKQEFHVDSPTEPTNVKNEFLVEAINCLIPEQNNFNVISPPSQPQCSSALRSSTLWPPTQRIRVVSERQLLNKQVDNQIDCQNKSIEVLNKINDNLKSLVSLSRKKFQLKEKNFNLAKRKFEHKLKMDIENQQLKRSKLELEKQTFELQSSLD